jgi:hypothetical protein
LRRGSSFRVLIAYFFKIGNDVVRKIIVPLPLVLSRQRRGEWRGKKFDKWAKFI